MNLLTGDRSQSQSGLVVLAAPIQLVAVLVAVMSAGISAFWVQEALFSQQPTEILKRLAEALKFLE
jgi:hypothetical protein